MIDSVVDLVEEHVDLGGSQFSELILERWYFARISQRNGTCFFHLASRPDLSRIGFGVGWVGWKIFACLATSLSGCRATSEPNSLFHSCFNEIFAGGRGDMYTFSKKTSPVFSQQLLEYNKLEVSFQG